MVRIGPAPIKPVRTSSAVDSEPSESSTAPATRGHSGGLGPAVCADGDRVMVNGGLILGPPRPGPSGSPPQVVRFRPGQRGRRRRLRTAAAGQGRRAGQSDWTRAGRLGSRRSGVRVRAAAGRGGPGARAGNSEKEIQALPRPPGSGHRDSHSG